MKNAWHDTLNQLCQRVQGAPRHHRFMAVVLGAALAAFNTPAAAQISVDDLELRLHVKGRAPLTGTIRVRNEGDHDVQAQVTLGDWRRDLDGRNEFLPFGTVAGSCSGRLQAFPSAVVVPAHSSEVVRVQVTTDSLAPSGCWGMVFVEPNERPSKVKDSAIYYIVRSGVKVYVSQDGALADADILETSVHDTTDAATPRRDVVVRFQNRGTAHLATHGSVEIRRDDNSLVRSIPVSEFLTTPGAVRRLIVPVTDTLASGRYVVLVMLDYDGREVLADQAQFIVP